MLQKQLVHTLSCACVERWMHAESLESTQEAKVALSCALSISLSSSHALQTFRVHPQAKVAKEEPKC